MNETAKKKLLFVDLSIAGLMFFNLAVVMITRFIVGIFDQSGLFRECSFGYPPAQVEFFLMLCSKIYIQALPAIAVYVSALYYDIRLKKTEFNPMKIILFMVIMSIIQFAICMYPIYIIANFIKDFCQNI